MSQPKGDGQQWQYDDIMPSDAADGGFTGVADAEGADGAGVANADVTGADAADGAEIAVNIANEGIAPDSERFEAVAEAVLFASGEPLSLERIALIVERPASDVKKLLEGMEARLRDSKRGLLLREFSGKYQLCTRPELSAYVDKLFEIHQKHSLSQAAYETLSIIAYNANVTRAAIEKIRGVNSDSSVTKLLERNLIAETGRANLPGRPMQYDVTDEFYRLFGFKSRKDLPDIGGGENTVTGDVESAVIRDGKNGVARGGENAVARSDEDAVTRGGDNVVTRDNDNNDIVVTRDNDNNDKNDNVVTREAENANARSGEDISGNISEENGISG